MKNKLNKKGFTLVELLAVIVVLAIISVIAFTSISGVISNARKNAWASNLKMLEKSIKQRKALNELDGSTYTCDNASACTALYGGSAEDYNQFKVTASGYEISASATAGQFKGEAKTATGSF